jgi:hypothetical protein
MIPILFCPVKSITGVLFGLEWRISFLPYFLASYSMFLYDALGLCFSLGGVINSTGIVIGGKFDLELGRMEAHLLRILSRNYEYKILKSVIYMPEQVNGL